MHTHQYYSIEEMKAKFGGFNDFPDELLVETKKARMRANSVEANKDRIGSTLVAIIMKPFG